MHSKQLLARALKNEFLSLKEGQFLFKNTAAAELMYVANELRMMPKMVEQVINY